MGTEENVSLSLAALARERDQLQDAILGRRGGPIDLGPFAGVLLFGKPPSYWRALEATLRRVVEALEEVEWIRDKENDYEYCPSCDATVSRGPDSRLVSGHGADCTTKAALADAQKSLGG